MLSALPANAGLHWGIDANRLHPEAGQAGPPSPTLLRSGCLSGPVMDHLGPPEPPVMACNVAVPPLVWPLSEKLQVRGHPPSSRQFGSCYETITDGLCQHQLPAGACQDLFALPMPLAPVGKQRRIHLSSRQTLPAPPTPVDPDAQRELPATRARPLVFAVHCPTLPSESRTVGSGTGQFCWSTTCLGATHNHQHTTHMYREPGGSLGIEEGKLDTPSSSRGQRFWPSLSAAHSRRCSVSVSSAIVRLHGAIKPPVLRYCGCMLPV